MSKREPLDIKDWIIPGALEPAEGVVDASPEKPLCDQETVVTGQKPCPETTPEPQSDGLDPKMLLGMMGNDNPGISTLLNLMNGEKLDIVALLPLLMQMGKKEKTDDDVKLNLDDYTVIS